jgi:glucose-6-phosphate isomerase
LSIEFVYEALRFRYPQKDRTLRFLANVDPLDFEKAFEGLNPAETLVLINSKTFTTAETMLNARTARRWLVEHLKDHSEAAIVKQHMCACSTNLEQTSLFGIDDDKVFGFWDFVGGRFSVWSAIGMLPLSVFFGYEVTEQFLQGGRNIDESVLKDDLSANVPLLLGLLDFYHSSI